MVVGRDARVKDLFAMLQNYIPVPGYATRDRGNSFDVRTFCALYREFVYDTSKTSAERRSGPRARVSDIRRGDEWSAENDRDIISLERLADNQNDTFEHKRAYKVWAPSAAA